MKNASVTATFVHLSLPEAVVNWTAKSSISPRTVLFLLLILVWAPGAFAKKHPVDIPKGADCASCHEDKTKGKNVHSAIAMGCTSCHEVRTNKDATHVKLITATPYKLCLTCHADKDATQIKGRVHPPAVRDCLKCHDPHTSENKNQLLKATSGQSKDDNLCLSCHTKGMNVPPKGSRHAALDMGCETCHSVHKSGEVGKTEFDYHLTKAAPALCIDCHDPKDATLIKAHKDQPFGSANCLSCHDAHDSAAPKLMAKFTHPPFADKQCEVCHAPAKDGKVVLTQKDKKALCVTCHDDQAKKIETAKVQHAGAAGDCTDCHNPHAGSQPGLPKTNAVAICLDCHSDIADLKQKRVHHQPAFGEGCATCHDAHGNDNPRLLRTASTNALCMECHGPEREPKKLEATHEIAIFNEKVKLPENYFSKTPIIPVRYGSGHPVDKHPVSDTFDPSNPKKVTNQLTCLSCHQPHASAKQGLLAKDQANDIAFCRSCHSNGLDLSTIGSASK
jgi:predicted CXXCH cytochrome family protein